MIVDSYVPKTQPWEHQAREFERFKDSPLWALAFEQRCGKTKCAIDKAARLYELGQIDALMVIAMPSGVPANWERDEIPIHMPDRIPREVVLWRSSLAKNKGFQRRLDALVQSSSLAILLVNGEAIITPTFQKFVKTFLARRITYAVADETTLIMKTPGTARTRAMHAIARHPRVPYRTIMDGTIAGEGPFDLYAQYAFLSPRIIGYTSFFAFRNRYGMWTKGYAGDREYPKLVQYQNLDELYDRTAPYTSRVTRRQAFPNMPEKTYYKARFELTDTQRRVYDQLRDQYETELRTGERVTATHVLTRYLRLQQVASNYWPSETIAALCGACEGMGCETCEGAGVVEMKTRPRMIDESRNPRIECLEDQFSRDPDPAVVWCRFVPDVDAVMELCTRLGRLPVRHDGSCSQDEKIEAREALQQGKAMTLVGTPRTGGRGLDMRVARTIYYYSNDFSLLSRLQSEDRAEAAKRSEGTRIVDLIANDTVDDRIVDALREKRKLTDVVMREDSGAWL